MRRRYQIRGRPAIYMRLLDVFLTDTHLRRQVIDADTGDLLYDLLPAVGGPPLGRRDRDKGINR